MDWLQLLGGGRLFYQQMEQDFVRLQLLQGWQSVEQDFEQNKPTELALQLALGPELVRVLVPEPVPVLGPELVPEPVPILGPELEIVLELELQLELVLGLVLGLVLKLVLRLVLALEQEQFQAADGEERNLFFECGVVRLTLVLNHELDEESPFYHLRKRRGTNLWHGHHL